MTATSIDPSTGKSDKIYGMNVSEKQIRRVLSPPGTEEKDHNEVFDFYTDVLSAPGTSANPRACTGADGVGVYDYVEALGQVLTPGSKERTTPRDTKFNHASRHPMAKSGLDETIFLTYMEDLEEGYGHTMMEYEENGTNFCQNNTLMSERKIKEWVTCGSSRVLIDKTHKLLLLLLEYIRKQSRAEGASFNIGPAMATLKHYNVLLWKIRSRGRSRREIVLKNYICLRNGAHLDWQDSKITACLWVDVREATALARLCGKPPAPAVAPVYQPDAVVVDPLAPPRKMTCSHCRSAWLHTLIRPPIAGDKSACPLKHLPQSIAKDARKRITDAFKEDGSRLTVDAAFMQPHIAAAETGA